MNLKSEYSTMSNISRIRQIHCHTNIPLALTEH